MIFTRQCLPNFRAGAVAARWCGYQHQVGKRVNPVLNDFEMAYSPVARLEWVSLRPFDREFAGICSV